MISRGSVDNSSHIPLESDFLAGFLNSAQRLEVGGLRVRPPTPAVETNPIRNLHVTQSHPETL